MNYERFAQKYGISDRARTSSAVDGVKLFNKSDPSSPALEGVTDLQRLFGEMLILNGLYGIFGPERSLRMTQLCLEFFPDFQGNIVAVAQDWLGYLYCADLSRMIEGKPTIILFDINTMDAMTTEMDIEAFHNNIVVEPVDEVFNTGLYDAWQAVHQPISEIGRCVGYVIPLALGGMDDFTNMEEADLEVYWSITGQIGVP